MHRTLLFSIAVLLSALTTAQADTRTAVFAGGCFWCMESDFEKLPGVSEVISGFTGGELQNPTYRGDHRGHVEAVEVHYDPAVISYAQLLRHFWVNIDPFDDRGQFCDKGAAYRTGLFVADADERAAAEASLAEAAEVLSARFGDRPIVTPIRDAGRFWPITGDESYHQDYYKSNPVRYNYYRWNCGRDQRLDAVWGEHREAVKKSG